MSHARWISEVSSKLAEDIDYLAIASARFREEVTDGHTHRHVCQKIINAPTHAAIQQGHVDVKGRTFKRGTPAPDVSQEWYLAYLYSQGDPVRLITQLAVTRKMALTHLLDAMLSSLNSGNLLVAMICGRSVIENVAHFDKAFDELKIAALPTTYEEARELKADVVDRLNSRVLAQKIDWRALSENPRELIRKNKLKYKPDDLRLNLSAEQILNLVDDLNKKVIGTRGTYEILCEFAHPNVGVVFALTESSSNTTDKNSVLWIEKQMSLNAPAGAVKEMHELFTEVFAVIADCVRHFEKTLASEFEPRRDRLKELCQIIVRHLLPNTFVPGSRGDIRLREAVDAYSDCPCNSGMKVKFCCGKP